MILKENHNAIVNATSLYNASQFTIRDVTDYKHRVLKVSTNKKLGKVITKGKHKGKVMLTLTLIERETCTNECEHYTTCYGNNMPFAHRFEVNEAFMMRLESDIEYYVKKYPQGILIRLHVLGDFDSVQYVEFWNRMLYTYNTIAIYGYSRNHMTSKYAHISAIGYKIIRVRTTHKERFAIRFSNKLDEEFSANSRDITDKGITCLAQVKSNVSCSDCTLCWSSKKAIGFITH
tara:strand:+ start:3243 stop:3941 length:699 start_codon:yes stop_codon:yes gene_type:complete